MGLGVAGIERHGLDADADACLQGLFSHPVEVPPGEDDGLRAARDQFRGDRDTDIRATAKDDHGAGVSRLLFRRPVWLAAPLDGVCSLGGWFRL